MKLLKLFLLFVLFGSLTPAFAETPQEFCANALDANGNLNYDWFQQNRGLDPTYQIGFANDGGLFDGGVCWWHSQWTRNAIYQTILAPELPKPTQAEAEKIIKDVMNSARVVVIGGYSSLAQFTDEWKPLLQKTLNAGQDKTALDFGWLKGLQGSEQENPATLEASMDRLNTEVNTNHKIVYQMLQLPGVDSHAWLVMGIQATDTGYHLQISDSNYPAQITTFDYVRGDSTEGLLYNQTKFIAYTQDENQFSTYENNVSDYCRSLSSSD